jgi:hypothetical protein
VATLAGATIKGNSDPSIATEPSDPPLELVPRHVVISHTSVRISTHLPWLRVLYQNHEQNGSRAKRLLAGDRGAVGERLELGQSEIARDVISCRNRGGDQPLGRQVREGDADADGDGFRRLGLGVAHADDAKDHGLVAEAVKGRQIEIGLSGFDRDLLDLRGGQLRQECVAVRLIAGDIGVAEVEVQRGSARGCRVGRSRSPAGPGRATPRRAPAAGAP